MILRDDNITILVHHISICHVNEKWGSRISFRPRTSDNKRSKTQRDANRLINRVNGERFAKKAVIF